MSPRIPSLFAVLAYNAANDPVTRLHVYRSAKAFRKDPQYSILTIDLTNEQLTEFVGFQGMKPLNLDGWRPSEGKHIG